MTAPGAAPGRLADLVALFIVAVITVAAVGTGVRTGYHPIDTDEAVYRGTLVRMRHGESYYSAMRDALVHDKRERPTQVRSLRPPTMFLLLRWLPPASWRWVVGLVYLGMLLAAWRIGRPYGTVGGPLACVFVGAWVLGFASFLFLHPELWGAPFFLAGLVAVRRGDDRAGAALMAAATVVRELFGLGLVLGLVLARRRRPWVAAGAVVAILVLVHAALAAHVLAAHGYEAAFGNEKRTASFLLTLISPGGTLGEKLVGALTIVAGVLGASRAQATDRAARLALVFGVVMLALTVWSTRRYWSPVWAPPLACFVPAALRPPPWRVSGAGPS